MAQATSTVLQRGPAGSQILRGTHKNGDRPLDCWKNNQTLAIRFQNVNQISKSSLSPSSNTCWKSNLAGPLPIFAQCLLFYRVLSEVHLNEHVPLTRVTFRFLSAWEIVLPAFTTLAVIVSLPPHPLHHHLFLQMPMLLTEQREQQKRGGKKRGGGE